MNLKEAAFFLGVSHRHLWDEANAGNVRVARMGRRLIFRLTDLNRYLERLSAKSAA